MARFVRASSYRHVFGTPNKDQESFLGTKAEIADSATNMAANPKFVAVPWKGGGGPVWVAPLKAYARLGAVPLVQTHKGKVQDLQFHPFMDNILATGSDDGYIHLNQIPDGGLKDHITTPLAALQAHGKKVTLVNFHPTSNNILASLSTDNTVKVWDVEAQSEVSNYEVPENPLHLDWNTNGSLAAVALKDKTFVLLDPRDSKTAQTAPSFQGTKKTSILFADNLGLIIGVGSNASSTRQLAVWDPKNLSKPLHTTDLDQNSGVIHAAYDADNTILWLAGKGDASVKYYEVTKDTPYLHPLSEFRDTQSQKGGCFLPKRAVDVKKCEIAVYMRLMAESVVPVSFQVPRKSDLFQKDLFPDTFAGVAAQTSKDYLAGKNADPVLRSMKPGESAPAQAAGATLTVAEKKPTRTAEELHAKIAELEAEVARLKLKVGE